MAKRVSEQHGGTDKGGMRILYVELNGSNASLQEGLRTLVAAMNKPVQVGAPVPRRLVASQTAAAPAEEEPAAELFNQEAGAVGGAEVEAGQPAETSQGGGSRRKRGEGTKTDRNAGINPVADLDFVPDSKPALKAFFAEKAPANDMEQILVLGYYIQHTIGVNAFGPGHILSAFKHVGKPIPVDLRQTMRNMKKGKVWFAFADVESVRLTTEGENVVEHELPRTGGKGDSGSK